MAKPADKLDAKRQKQVKDWLKGHGHKAAKIDTAKLDTLADLRALMCELHQVSPDFYRSIIGG